MRYIYYIVYSGEHYEELRNVPFEFIGEYSASEKATVLFSNLFSDTYSFVPEGTRLLFASMHQDELILNVNKEMISYGGGSSYENRLQAQIILTALDIPNVNKVTLLVEGYLEYLPEGSLIYQVSTIPEL